MAHGTGNTMIGRGSQTNANGSQYHIVLGYNVTGAGDNHLTFGSSSGSDRVYNGFTSNASWTRASDIRYKDNIQNNTDCGLAFINELRPVTFKFKALADIDNTLPDYDEDATSRKYDKKMYGLIAQEVKAALDKHNFTAFGGWNEEESTEIQGISQEMFDHQLIKAVQELSAKNEALEARIATLEG